MCSWCSYSPIVNELTAGLRHRSGPSHRTYDDPGSGTTAGATTTVPAGADVIFHSGTIRTMAAQDCVEALAIAGTTILASGSRAEVSRTATRTTQFIDLNGRTLLPGFIDPHHHYTLTAWLTHTLPNLGYARFPRRAQVLEELARICATTPAGQWVTAGFFDNLLQGGDLSIADLDHVSREHPIFVMYVNGHVGVASSMAMNRADVSADIGTLPGGGHFGRAADGTLNGMMYEQSALMRFVTLAAPPLTRDLIARALTLYAKQAAAAGNTTLHEPGTVQPDWIADLAQLSNTLAVRLSASLSSDAIDAAQAFVTLCPSDTARQIPGTRLSLYGIKLWADGSNQAQMAAQSQPYLNSTNAGSPNYQQAEITQLCQAVKDAGWPVLIHCQGDAAIDQALNAIEQTYGANPTEGINRIEHATMARDDQLIRMKTLGVEPSFIPDFVHLYGGAYRDQIFGDPRASSMSPAGAAHRTGLRFSLHSDAPATGLPINPLRHVQTAVTRRCAIDQSIVGADLSVPIDAAMRAITIDAAHHLGLADTIGTLEPGKQADLTITNNDPYTVSPNDIANITINQTWLAGRRVFPDK